MIVKNGTAFFINGETFVPPTVPVLLQIMSGAQTAADLLPSGSVYTLPSNATVEISFPITATNAPGAPHPFHLHGVSPALCPVCTRTSFTSPAMGS